MEVLEGGTGGRDAEVASATVEMGSPLLCSMVVAMPRRINWGAKRRVARRSAIVMVVCGICGRWKERDEVEMGRMEGVTTRNVGAGIQSESG